MAGRSGGGRLPAIAEDGLARLRAGYLEPVLVADREHARGRAVVGLVGWGVPRELVVAAGMSPIRLPPGRLMRRGDDRVAALPASLTGELTPETALVLAAALGGALDWVDALVIGRDSEAHTKLFYVLRELRRTGHSELPPFAFCDLLRLPYRTSARYNRLRARDLADTIGAWAGRQVGAADLANAVAESRATAACLRVLDDLRIAPAPGIRGSEALIAAGAAQVLDAGEAQAALSAAARAARPSPGTRVMMTGSGLDEPWVYEVLEGAGLCIVGEDHEWGDDGRTPPQVTTDPLDGIVDRYHLVPPGARRNGLSERAAHIATRSVALGVAGVLQVVVEGDDAPGWELPRFRAVLNVPVVSVALAPGDRNPEPLQEAAAELLRLAAGG